MSKLHKVRKLNDEMKEILGKDCHFSYEKALILNGKIDLYPGTLWELDFLDYFGNEEHLVELLGGEDGTYNFMCIVKWDEGQSSHPGYWDISPHWEIIELEIIEPLSNDDVENELENIHLEDWWR